uniref:Thaumatin-like protein n=2 Tax=Oryza sativa subsp. japonica TaxID=39947 RepID=Q8GVZ1_ORYSJ|nr:thaumatin-like protein [Oryza sativa Japonica Group]
MATGGGGATRATSEGEIEGEGGMLTKLAQRRGDNGNAAAMDSSGRHGNGGTPATSGEGGAAGAQHSLGERIEGLGREEEARYRGELRPEAAMAEVARVRGEGVVSVVARRKEAVAGLGIAAVKPVVTVTQCGGGSSHGERRPELAKAMAARVDRGEGGSVGDWRNEAVAGARLGAVKPMAQAERRGDGQGSGGAQPESVEAVERGGARGGGASETGRGNGADAGVKNSTLFSGGKSTPKVPQLVIELQNRPAKPVIQRPSSIKTGYNRSFAGGRMRVSAAGEGRRGGSDDGDERRGGDGGETASGRRGGAARGRRGSARGLPRQPPPTAHEAHEAEEEAASGTAATTRQITEDITKGSYGHSCSSALRQPARRSSRCATTAPTPSGRPPCPETQRSGAIGGGDFKLSPGANVSFPAPDGWSDRLWARTDCAPSGTASLACATGYFGGAVSCSLGGAPPVTLAEFTLGGADGKDFYDGRLNLASAPASSVSTATSASSATTTAAADFAPSSRDIPLLPIGQFPQDHVNLGSASAAGDAMINSAGAPAGAHQYMTNPYAGDAMINSSALAGAHPHMVNPPPYAGASSSRLPTASAEWNMDWLHDAMAEQQQPPPPPQWQEQSVFSPPPPTASSPLHHSIWFTLHTHPSPPPPSPRSPPSDGSSCRCRVKFQPHTRRHSPQPISIPALFPPPPPTP